MWINQDCDCVEIELCSLKSVEKNIVTVTSFFRVLYVYLPLFWGVVLSGNVFTCFRNYAILNSCNRVSIGCSMVEFK